MTRKKIISIVSTTNETFERCGGGREFFDDRSPVAKAIYEKEVPARLVRSTFYIVSILTINQYTREEITINHNKFLSMMAPIAKRRALPYYSKIYLPATS